MDDYVDFGDKSGTFISDPSLSGELSVFLWIKIQGGYYIISSGAQTSSKGFAISYQNSSEFIYLKDGTSSWGVNPSWNTGEWINIGFTWDGNSLEYYKNGSINISDSLPRNESRSDTQTDLTLGVPNNFKTNYHFSGILDDVRIYNRALSEDEVKEIYNATR